MLAITNNESTTNERLAIFPPPIGYTEPSRISGPKTMDRQGESCPHHLLCLEMRKLLLRKKTEDIKKAGENIPMGSNSLGSKAVQC
jgi:hypothetical protein